MTERTKKAAAIGGGVLALSVGAFFLMGNRAADIPGIGELVEPSTCPLSGVEPDREALLDRPAVAVKIENAAVAYPLSGLEDAEIVYEELVEGGVTRFMAIYHCTDSVKAGPVRSARIVDPAIMVPITRILAYSGENSHVLEALQDAEIVRVDEDAGNGALSRVERPGISFEHTLYADTTAARKIGRKEWSDPPPDDMFDFGDLEGKSKKASEVTINFSAAGTLRYEWDGESWMRFEGDAPFMTEAGEQIGVDNVLIEEHEVNFSTIVDVTGNPSVEIADETGSGRAVLFRDGRAIRGTWTRESADSAVLFETRAGDRMVFKEGSIWIHLVPSDEGELKGSFSFAK